MKSLQEVLSLDYHEAHNSSGWNKAGFGPTNWTTVKSLLGKNPVDTGATDAPANIDIDFKKKLMAFFDTLGEILVHDYPHDTSVFDVASTQTATGRRPADRVVGECLEDERVGEIIRRNQLEEDTNLLLLGFSLINEATIQEVGRLYEATVTIRGLQRNLKVFYPSMGVASRRQLQESLNKVLSGVVVVKVVALAEQGRISNAPLIVLEDADIYINENVVYDAVSDTFIIFEARSPAKQPKPPKQPKETKPPRRPSRLVEAAFDRYREALVEAELEKKI